MLVERTCRGCGKLARGTPIPRHRVMCGDARDAADVARLIARPVAVAVTSPPYATRREYDETSGFKPIPPDEYVAWFRAIQEHVRAHLAPDGSWFVNIKEHAEDGQRALYVKDLTLAHVRLWGWRLVDEFAWMRAGVPGGWGNRFKNGWEPVFHFSTQQEIKFRPEAVSHESEHVFDYSPANGKSVSGSGLLGKEHAANFRAGLARPSNVLEIGSGGSKVSGEHPAEYPVGLPEFFIRAFSDAGDLVFDPFGGSGTTLIAAAKNGRFSALMEISPGYCDVIRRRFTVYARSAGLEPGPGGLEGT